MFLFFIFREVLNAELKDATCDMKAVFFAEYKKSNVIDVQSVSEEYVEKTFKVLSDQVANPLRPSSAQYIAGVAVAGPAAGSILTSPRVPMPRAFKTMPAKASAAWRPVGNWSR